MSFPTIPVADCARVAIRGALASRPVAMYIWCRCLAPPITAGLLGTLAFRVAVLQAIAFKNALSADYSSVAVEAQDYSSGPGAVEARSFLPGPGLAASMEPASIALRLLNVTSPVAQAHSSTNWVAGIPKGVIVGDQFNHDWADGMALNWSNLIVNLPIFGWQFVSVSGWLGGVPRTAGLVAEITDVRVATYTVAPRRKRLESH